MRVANFMTPAPETIEPHEMLAVARAKMDRGRFRRLPVVDGQGALVGILTDGDLRAHGGYLDSSRVTAAMVENPLTIGADDAVEKALELMLERKIGGLPVLDAAGKLAGIVTESDLLRAYLMQLRSSAKDARS